MPESAFQISLPEVKAKAFPVHGGRRKIMPAGRKRRLFRLAGQRLFCGNISDVVAALGFGNNIALCGKLKISVYHCCAAKMKLLRTFTQRRHPASGKKLPGSDQISVIVVILDLMKLGAVSIL